MSLKNVCVVFLFFSNKYILFHLIVCSICRPRGQLVRFQKVILKYLHSNSSETCLRIAQGLGRSCEPCVLVNTAGKLWQGSKLQFCLQGFAGEKKRTVSFCHFLFTLYCV